MFQRNAASPTCHLLNPQLLEMRFAILEGAELIRIEKESVPILEIIGTN